MADALDWAGLRKAYENTPGGIAPDQELARELAEERAAIMQYDGEMSRHEAEARAAKDIARLRA